MTAGEFAPRNRKNNNGIDGSVNVPRLVGANMITFLKHKQNNFHDSTNKTVPNIVRRAFLATKDSIISFTQNSAHTNLPHKSPFLAKRRVEEKVPLSTPCNPKKEQS